MICRSPYIIYTIAKVMKKLKFRHKIESVLHFIRLLETRNHDVSANHPGTMTENRVILIKHPGTIINFPFKTEDILKFKNKKDLP